MNIQGEAPQTVAKMAQNFNMYGLWQLITMFDYTYI
jgi:hypothetical protein